MYGKKFDIFSYHKSLRYLSKHNDLNDRQRRWVESLQDYQYTLHYHPGKANVVADALSQKPRGVLSCLITSGWKMLSNLEEVEWTSESILSSLWVVWQLGLG